MDEMYFTGEQSPDSYDDEITLIYQEEGSPCQSFDAGEEPLIESEDDEE